MWGFAMTLREILEHYIHAQAEPTIPTGIRLSVTGLDSAEQAIREWAKGQLPETKESNGIPSRDGYNTAISEAIKNLEED